MAWTVTTANKVVTNGQVMFDLVFVEDGIEKGREPHRLNVAPDATWLQERAAAGIARLTDLQTFAAALPATITPQAAPAPDAAAVIFQRDLRRCQMIDILIRLNWVSPTHVKVIEVKDRVLANLAAHWDQFV